MTSNPSSSQSEFADGKPFNGSPVTMSASFQLHPLIV